MGKLLLMRQLGEDTDPQRAGNHGDSPESLERTETYDVMGWTGEALARERAETRPVPTSCSIPRFILMMTL